MANLTRIAYEVADGVATVSLNRPRKRNALDAETVTELAGVLHAVDEAEDVRVVLLRGEGQDFCAGADLAELERLAATSDPLQNLADATAMGQLFIHMRRLRRPVVGAVHGHALAGGAGLATACDIVLASEDAVFGYPEVHLGFVPAMVMALLRRSVGEKAAFELVALGERFGAAEAHRLGLVNRVLPAAGFDEACRQYARSLAGRSPSALALIKRLLYGMDGVPFESAIDRGAEINALARMGADTRAGVRRFLEERGREEEE